MDKQRLDWKSDSITGFFYGYVTSVKSSPKHVLKMPSTKKGYSLKKYWAPSLWSDVLDIVGDKRSPESRKKASSSKDDSKSNRDNTDTYCGTYIRVAWHGPWWVLEKQCNLRIMENLGKKRFIPGRRIWETFLEEAWWEMASGKDSGPLPCFMTKGQLRKRYCRQRRRCNERWEGGGIFTGLGGWLEVFNS